MPFVKFSLAGACLSVAFLLAVFVHALVVPTNPRSVPAGSIGPWTTSVTLN